jgi:protein-glutamine gamma-glutamyltransferase
MLRSQGIPARMVVGYKGGDFNSLGRYYVVQQRHAHAWVEAWLPAGAIDEREIAGQPSRGGSWFRLDPTPAVRETFTAGDEDGIGHRLSQAFDYVELLWRDYVLSLSAERQQDALFDPLTARASAIPAWAEGRSFQRWLRHWSARLGLDGGAAGDRGPRRGFDVFTALVVAGALLLGLPMVRVALWLRKRTGGWLRNSPNGPGPVCRAPEFYLRLERMLARAGLRRGRGQTPRELAAAAENRLAGHTAETLSAIPTELVEAYYRVRFGDGRLDKDETKAIEHALAVLAPALNQAGKQ